VIGVTVAFAHGLVCGASVWLFAAAWLEVRRSPGLSDGTMRSRVLIAHPLRRPLTTTAPFVSLRWIWQIFVRARLKADHLRARALLLLPRRSNAYPDVLVTAQADRTVRWTKRSAFARSPQG
jgi:hypothetical protein